MKKCVPVRRSILSCPALASIVEDAYDLGEVVRCRFLFFGLNDTYQVETRDERFVLRIYRKHWRSDPDIHYEVDLLRHLADRGVSVSLPLARNDGSCIIPIEAPEGLRSAVLFTFAKGQENPRHLGSEEQIIRYGRAVAALHEAANDFTSPHRRFRLDAVHLLDEPMTRIRTLFDHRPDDWDYLQRLVEDLHGRMAALPAEAPGWGVCHGDLHGGNCHYDGDTLTFFDFDCCGLGWRSYDLAVYLWGPCGGKDGPLWRAYLDGYRSGRRIDDLDLRTIPLFVMLRQIWYMGLIAGAAEEWGEPSDSALDESLSNLKAWSQGEPSDSN